MAPGPSSTKSRLVKKMARAGVMASIPLGISTKIATRKLSIMITPAHLIFHPKRNKIPQINWAYTETTAEARGKGKLWVARKDLNSNILFQLNTLSMVP